MTEKELIRGNREVLRKEFPGNSHKQKEQEKQKKEIKKVVSGKTARKKKSLVQKAAGSFFGGDLSDVMGYVVDDVLLPAFRKLVWEGISNGAEMLIFGEVRSKKTKSGFNNYGKYFREASSGRSRDRRSRSRGEVDDIEFDDRWEAQDVLDSALDYLEQYDEITVADIYEMAGEDYDHVDTQYGWDNLKGARVVRSKDCYILELPRPYKLEG